jgi:hypothetical protein
MKAKDEQLVDIAELHNVAQFVSFSAGTAPTVRFSRVRGRPHDERLDPEAAIGALLARSVGRVNVRSFLPEKHKGNPFTRNLNDVSVVVNLVRKLASHGYVTIVNEALDIDDGGVSGVLLNDIIEFVPEDTPRGVEKGEEASLPYSLGMKLLEIVYGFKPELPEAKSSRVEFSLHPLRVGYRQSHTVLWEWETAPATVIQSRIRWPNRFSRFIGDKVFGLLIADLIGLPVPSTKVVARSVAPFQFGQSTHTGEIWTRPCPREQEPGLYPTSRGWVDPYALLKLGEPEGTAIASVLAQDGVDATYSGATLPSRDAEGDEVEGVAGFGDRFMQGDQSPDPLPRSVVREIRSLAHQARQSLGPVRLEFAHDGQRAWVLQLHLSSSRYDDAVINPGEPAKGWLDYEPSQGLDKLRTLIQRVQETEQGIRVRGSVALTSHVGDLLRRAGVPAVRQPPR